jgi:hypothetical protein
MWIESFAGHGVFRISPVLLSARSIATQIFPSSRPARGAMGFEALKPGLLGLSGPLLDFLLCRPGVHNPRWYVCSCHRQGHGTTRDEGRSGEAPKFPSQKNV